jgi:hypothetical protein
MKVPPLFHGVLSSLLKHKIRRIIEQKFLPIPLNRLHAAVGAFMVNRDFGVVHGRHVHRFQVLLVELMACTRYGATGIWMGRRGV